MISYSCAWMLGFIYVDVNGVDYLKQVRLVWNVCELLNWVVKEMLNDTLVMAYDVKNS